MEEARPKEQEVTHAFSASYNRLVKGNNPTSSNNSLENKTTLHNKNTHEIENNTRKDTNNKSTAKIVLTNCLMMSPLWLGSAYCFKVNPFFGVFATLGTLIVQIPILGEELNAASKKITTHQSNVKYKSKPERGRSITDD